MGCNFWLGSPLPLIFGERPPERGELPVRFQCRKPTLDPIISAAAQRSATEPAHVVHQNEIVDLFVYISDQRH
jgi:hypothetical protein